MNPDETSVDSRNDRSTKSLPDSALPLQRLTWAIRLLSGLVMILTPGFLLAGIMGLAREGHRGPFFFIEQAFYCSTMLYPLVWIACTAVSLAIAKRDQLFLALFVQSLPILIPVLLYVATSATERI